MIYHDLPLKKILIHHQKFWLLHHSVGSQGLQRQETTSVQLEFPALFTKSKALDFGGQRPSDGPISAKKWWSIFGSQSLAMFFWLFRSVYVVILNLMLYNYFAKLTQGRSMAYHGVVWWHWVSQISHPSRPCGPNFSTQNNGWLVIPSP